MEQSLPMKKKASCSVSPEGLAASPLATSSDSDKTAFYHISGDDGGRDDSDEVVFVSGPSYLPLPQRKRRRVVGSVKPKNRKSKLRNLRERRERSLLSSGRRNLVGVPSLTQRKKKWMWQTRHKYFLLRQRRNKSGKDPVHSDDNIITLRNKKVVVKGECAESDAAIDSDDNFLISDSAVGSLNNKIIGWIDKIKSTRNRSRIANFKGTLFGQLKAILPKLREAVLNLGGRAVLTSDSSFLKMRVNELTLNLKASENENQRLREKIRALKVSKNKKGSRVASQTVLPYGESGEEVVAEDLRDCDSEFIPALRSSPSVCDSGVCGEWQCWLLKKTWLLLKNFISRTSLR